MVRLAALSFLALVVAACSSADETGQADDEMVASTDEALSAGGAVSRAQEWADAKLHYCQAPYGARDYDSACPMYCKRTSNAKWNPYRSDCSGYVSWAWGLPAPGRVTGQFAPFRNDITHTITASTLKPGDAVNNNHHVMLFEKWITPGKRAAFLEEPGCSSSKPYAHETVSDVSVKGSSIYVSAHGESFTAIRYGGLTADPPPAPPPPQPPRGTLDAISCNGVDGWAQDPESPKKAIDAVISFDTPVEKSSHLARVAADDKRDDLCKALGSCEHAYHVDLPLALKDGKQHTVYAYAASGKQRVAIGQKTITCAPPAFPLAAQQAVRRRVPALDAWSIDGYEDVAKEPSGTVSAYTDGTDLPAKPVAVKSDDGSPEVWVLDGAFRRHVADPASLAAWKLKVGVASAADIAALAEGPAWPEEPFAFQAAGTSAVYILDVPLPTTSTAPGGSATESPSNPKVISQSDAEGDPGLPDGEGTTPSANDHPSMTSAGCSASPRGETNGYWLALVALALIGARRGTSAAARRTPPR